MPKSLSSHPSTENTSRSSQIIGWTLVLLWCGFIFFMSAHTGNDLDNGSGLVATVKAWLQTALSPFFGPKSDVVSILGHFSEYLVLGTLLAHALSHHPSLSSGILVVSALALGSFYGATDELHQILVPGRFCDVADWITDTLGCAVGILIFMGLRTLRHKRKSSSVQQPKH